MFIFFLSYSLYAITTARLPSRPHLRSNSESAHFLPHDLITYGYIRPPARMPATSDNNSAAPSTVSSTSLSATTSVDPILASLQATALKELQKFTGDPTQRVTHFINAIEQLRFFSPLTDAMLHSIATLKLGGSAFNWYDNNKDSLNSWSLLKTNLLARFKPSLSAAKTQLKDRRQQPGESLLVYYDDVIDLCKQVDADMPLHMIVDYLQDGVRDELKIHIKRRMKTLTDTPSPAQFLTIARDEDELQQELSHQQSPIINTAQPYFAHITAATSTSNTRTNYSNNGLSYANQSSQLTHTLKPSSSATSRSATSQNLFRPCLICNRSNHRTINCYYKQPSGCFKCGASDHVVHKCPQVFQ